METKIGIKHADLASEAHTLSKILADEFLLYTKTLNAHWNVEGPNFHDKHIFFEGQYNQLAEVVDSVAERIRKLGHYAPATLKQYLELTQFTEESIEKNDGEGFIKELLECHESVILELRENVHRFADDFNDDGTSDFITGLMEKHETLSWMLRAHLK